MDKKTERERGSWSPEEPLEARTVARIKEEIGECLEEGPERTALLDILEKGGQCIVRRSDGTQETGTLYMVESDESVLVRCRGEEARGNEKRVAMDEFLRWQTEGWN